MIVRAPKSNNQMTYNEAILYCAFCAHDGHSDWRMPTEKEWMYQLDRTGWYLNDLYAIRRMWWCVIPVRDV